MNDNKTGSKLLTSTALFIYLALALGATIGHDWLLDMRVEPICRTLHQQVMTNNAPAPIQYRIFQYYAAEGLMRLGVPFGTAYFFLRFLFTFLAAVALHFFLAYWFAPVACILGTFYFFSVLPLVYYGYYMQPMDIPNLFFMLLGCILILKKKDLWLIPLIIVAMLNRETAIMLVLIYLLVRYDELDISALAVRTGLLFIAGIGTYIGLRAVFSMKHYYSDMYYLGSNLLDQKVYIHAAALFGPLIPLSIMKFGEKPRFIRRSLLMLPFFIVIHFTMTIMKEPRLWLPALPFLIAAAFWYVLPKELRIYKEEATKPVDNIIARNPRTAYLAMFAVFILFFIEFFYFYLNAHLSDRDKKMRVDNIVNTAQQYAAAQMTSRAIEELNKAVVIDPNNADPHYALGIIYYNANDYKQALYHCKETLRLNPYHLDKQRIEKLIEMLEYYLGPGDKRIRP
jgi:hypothetical protein